MFPSGRLKCLCKWNVNHTVALNSSSDIQISDHSGHLYSHSAAYVILRDPAQYSYWGQQKDGMWTRERLVNYEPQAPHPSALCFPGGGSRGVWICLFWFLSIPPSPVLSSVIHNSIWVCNYYFFKCGEVWILIGPWWATLAILLININVLFCLIQPFCIITVC